MRVLALADKRPPMDPALMAEQMGVQAVVCLGDLDLAWIESLRAPAIPKVGVHGNHDPLDLLREVEVMDLHSRRTPPLGKRPTSASRGCGSGWSAIGRATSRTATRTRRGVGLDAPRRHARALDLRRAGG